MNVALRRPWTQEEFFAWAEPREERYEFDGFHPVAMAGGNANHSALHRNILVALANRLGDGPCQPLGPDAGVSTANDAIRYPDALVTCSPYKGTDRIIPGVVIVFEVISPTSGRIDRIDKPREYAANPSIRRYVIVESTTIGLTVFSRTDADQPWTAATIAEDETLHLPEIGIEIPVTEIYRRIEFTPPPD